MNKTYYKVLNYSLKSSWAPSAVAIQYKVGEFVSGYQGLPLAVFDSLDAASNYRRSMGYRSWVIYECEIKNKTREPWLPGKSRYLSNRFYNLLKLFKTKKKFMHLAMLSVPEGTVTCQQVKLLQKVG